MAIFNTATRVTSSDTASDTTCAPAERLARALEVIRELASQGHTSRYIAGALSRRGTPTLSGRGTEWHAKTVWRLMQQHSIRTASGRVW